MMKADRSRLRNTGVGCPVAASLGAVRGNLFWNRLRFPASGNRSSDRLPRRTVCPGPKRHLSLASVAEAPGSAAGRRTSSQPSSSPSSSRSQVTSSPPSSHSAPWSGYRGRAAARAGSLDCNAGKFPRNARATVMGSRGSCFRGPGEA